MQQNTHQNTPTLLKDTVLIAVASAVIALTYNAFAGKPLPLIRTENRVVASDSLINALSANATEYTTAKPQSSTPALEKPMEKSSEKLTEKLPEKLTEKPGTKTAERILEKPSSQQSPAQEQQAAPKQFSVQLSPENSTPPSAQTPAKNSAQSMELRTDHVEKLLQNPDVLFIDARRASEYAQGHIGNAINIFTPEFEQHIAQVIGLPREKPIVVYCGGGACELSHELASHLRGLGFSKVFVYTGGWNEWQKRQSK